MAAPHLVPTPTSMTALPDAAFRIGSGAEITGDPAAVAALHRHLDPLPAAPSSGSIDLSVQAGGPAGSYRLAVGTASVAATGADAAGLFAGIQTLTQLLAEGPGATPERTWESFRTRVAALEPLWTRLGISFTPVAEGEPA